MSFFEKDELRVLWPFYLNALVSTLFFIYPAFWIIQLQETLTLTQIGLLFTAISISSFLFEIPTGAIADIYGRKFSTVLGYFLSGCALISLFFVKNFYGMLVIFFLWGISGTFISGAEQAWIADNLKYHKKDKLRENYFVKEHSFIRVSLFFAGFIGAFLVKQFGLGIIWPVTGFSLIISALILFFTKEHKVTEEKAFTFKNLFRQSRTSIQFSLRHKILFYLIIALFFVSFWNMFGGDIVWQPFLKNTGFPVYAFGFLFSGLTLVGGIAPYFAKPILRRIGKENNYLALAILAQIIIVFLVLFVTKWAYGVILLLSAFFAMDIYQPIQKNYFQKFIPSKMRATITSFQGMVMALAFALSAPLAGFLGDTLGPKMTIVLSGVFLIPAVILYLKIKDNKASPTERPKTAR